jgi:protein TonB
MPVGVSCLLHLGLATGLVLGQHWVPVAIAVRPPVLPVHLVTLDPVEEPRVAPPTPPPSPPPPRLRPPRLLEPPRPKQPPPVTKAQEPTPPPPAPVAPPAVMEPAPPASAPDSAPVAPTNEAAAPGPPVAVLAAASPTSEPAPAVAPPSATGTRTSRAVPEGVTQLARPQGGYQVRPSYPPAPRRLGIQGTTLLRVHVLADGRIGEVLVEKSGGHPDLDQAATEAVRAWRFDPARRGSEPVAMWVLLPVEFRLK